MVETFGLSSPVPQMMKTSPRKNVKFDGTAIVKWPKGDDPAANPDRLALTPEVVGDPAARQRRDVHERRVHSVDRSSRRDVESPARGSTRWSPWS